ncbi:glutamine--tRNA ligase/YqeY domain fusion protein [Euzebya sp.]|uniref:glutamine--tRNA ligase/YqeY domain fusion protein n=1 Tax=Euzebya sp. TaxID=1971409 RepID=UPI0035118270
MTAPATGDAPHPEAASDFIRDAIRADLESGAHDGRVQTRFPPEPNGYLHVGHAKSIILNFGLAEEFGGTCNLRFDDTNPVVEDPEFVTAIIEDIGWLGYEPEAVVHASDYFAQLYDWAEELIGKGLAYVDDQDAETISAQRGGYGQPGVESPHRDRTPEENLALFRGMRDGEFADGSKVLRAKIDMQHPNMIMRDPVLYRIRRVPHERTGTDWIIYPTYDWAHGQSDAIEGVTHSLCTLEFADHRPVYDWFLSHLDLPHSTPEQTEFARLQLTHTVMSKRILRRLVEEGVVEGWDDPRMPTLRGMRKRGYPPEALRAFVDTVGVAKTNSVVEVELLESFVRRHHNTHALRRMGVLRPLKVTITNWPEGHVEELEAINNPEDETAGTRTVPFSGELWIEADDFMLDPPRKYYRLSPGREVRLRGGYFITATDVVTDDAGEVVEVRCTYDPETRGGQAPDGRKVKATIHWVSAPHALDATVHLYDRLFTDPQPADPIASLNPDSRETVTAKVEPVIADTPPCDVIQLERIGYFAADPVEPLTLHRTVGLRDEWANIQKRQQGGGGGGK